MGSHQGGLETWPEEELNTVQVSMVEFEIDMPKLLPPGPMKFIVTNNGQNSHNFASEGPDGIHTLSKEPLKPGKYVICYPVFNDRARGMEVNLKVSNK